MTVRVSEILFAIDAPHFYAGVVVRNGRIVEAADIVKYMRGWNGERFADYCRAKGWRWEKVHEVKA